jgi:large-conductance mechanosensitive channel
MQVFIARDGQQTGPYSLEQARQMLRSGGASAEDLAWYEGAPEWLPLSKVPGIEDDSPPPPPLQPIRGTPRPVESSTSGAAVASLVLGIVSWIFLPFVAAIAAVITGHIGLGSIKRSAGAMRGRGMAIAGLIMGYIQVILIPIIIAIAVFASVSIPATNKIFQKAQQVKSLNNAQQILLACRVYAADNDGLFPPDLETLVPDYLVDESVLQTEPPSEDGEAVGFTYTPGLTETDSSSTILLESKLTFEDGKKVVGYVDGRVEVIRLQELGSP